MRVWWGWVCVVALLGCSGPQQQCSQDADCPGEARCDAAVQACVTCEPGICADSQECVRASCHARYRSITLVRPAGRVIAPGARFQARLELVDGRSRKDPPFLTYAIKNASGAVVASGSMLANGEGLFQSQWNVSSPGTYTLVMQYEAAGIASEPLEMTLDAEPPVVELVIPNPVRRDGSDPNKADERERDAAFLNAWRRDELVTVTIKASEPLDLGSSLVVLTQLPGGTPVGAPKPLVASSGCGAAFCATATVDLFEPPMAAFRGNFGLKLVTADVPGNPAEAGGSIAVTRQKWRFTAGTPIQGTPTIDDVGRVFFATSTGGASDKIYALKPVGVTPWFSFRALGVVRGSLVTGAEPESDALYYVADLGNGTVKTHALLAVDGAFINDDAVGCLTSGDSADGSGALLTINGSPSFVTVIRDSSGGAPVPATLLAYRHTQSVEAQRCKRFTADVRGIDFPGNIVSTGSDIFWNDNQGRLQSQALGADWSTRAGWPIAGVFARSLLLSVTDLLGTTLLPQGHALAVPLAGGTVSTFPNASATPFAAWSAALGAGSRFLFSRELPEIVLAAPRQAASTKQLGGSYFKSAPLFGEKGLIYTTDISGRLSVWDADLNPLWNISLGNFEFQASPTIDCTRDAAGKPIPGRPGVLYVASMAGTVDAIIVDSKGIDTTAPWPKYQHDPRNTGNSSTPLSEFACP